MNGGGLSRRTAARQDDREQAEAVFANILVSARPQHWVGDERQKKRNGLRGNWLQMARRPPPDEVTDSYRTSLRWALLTKSSRHPALNYDYGFIIDLQNENRQTQTLSSGMYARKGNRLTLGDKLLTQPGTIFEMQDAIIEGRQHLVWKHTPHTFREYLTTQFARWAPRELVSDPVPEPAGYYAREHVSYKEAFARAIELAAWLRDQGVRQGDRVGLGGFNSAAWIVAFVGIHLVGAVPVLLNATLQSKAQLHCLTLTKPKITLCDNRCAATLGPLAEKLALASVGPVYCYNSTACLPEDVRSGLREYAAARPPRLSIKEIEEGLELNNLGPESEGIIFFTSGTTSMPKGVVCTQRQCLHHVISGSIPGARAILRAGGTLEDALAAHTPPETPKTMLLAVPLFHVTGCLGWMVRAFLLGFKMVFMRRWNVGDAVRLCIDENIGMIGGVPAIATAIVQSPLLPRNHVFDSMVYGGAAAPQRLASDVAQRWPHAIATHAYGMTETNGLHCALTGQDYIDRVHYQSSKADTKPESVGHAVPTSAQRIVDPETLKPLPANTMGLLQCSGPNIMKCYVDNPKATAEAITPDGWLNTGDMAMICPEGFLYIRDRAKDVIIRGGENIPSAEVENEVYKDDRIAECAAVAVPDDLLGELVGIAVSLAPAVKATPESIKQAVDARLRHPARPVIVVIVPRIREYKEATLRLTVARNGNGKILKSEIKKIVGREWEAQRGRQSKAKL